MRCSADAACPYPAVREGLCRRHHEDITAESSMIPSTAAWATAEPLWEITRTVTCRVRGSEVGLKAVVSAVSFNAAESGEGRAQPPVTATSDECGPSASSGLPRVFDP